MGPPDHLLYLHGFRSSPRSFKAQRVRQWLQTCRADILWHCPQLPASPREAVEQVERDIAAWPKDRMAVVGSSLGGFYATWIAQRHGCRGVLVNPVVDPARDLAAHIGRQTLFHEPGEHFEFRREFIDELRALTLPSIKHPQRLMAVIATGDEVLDWREMAERYRGALMRVVEGSDHALSDFDLHLPHVMRFLQLCD